MAALDAKDIFDDDIALPAEFETMPAESIAQRARLLDNEIRVLKDDSTRLGLDQSAFKEKIKENKEKIKLNNQLPYLVSNIVEVLDVQPVRREDLGHFQLLKPQQGGEISCWKFRVCDRHDSHACAATMQRSLSGGRRGGGWCCC